MQNYRNTKNGRPPVVIGGALVDFVAKAKEDYTLMSRTSNPGPFQVNLGSIQKTAFNSANVCELSLC